MNDKSIDFAHLVDFVEGRLDADAAAELRRTLEAAGSAELDVQALREIVAELRALGPAPSPELIQRAVDLFPTQLRPSLAESLRRVPEIIGQLVFDGRDEPALAGFRGTADGYQLAYESDAVRVDLLISPARPDSDDTWRVRGQLDVRNGAMPGPVVLSRTDSDRAPVAHASIDDCGRFKIESAPGTYDLTVDLESATFVAPGIELG